MNKKPDNLADNLAVSRKYDPNLVGMRMPPGHPGQAPPQIDFNQLKKKLEDFKKKLLKKFPFTVALTILPPAAFPLFDEDEGLTPEEVSKKPIHMMMVMPEEQYKNLAKIKPEVIALAKETGENLWVHIKTAEVDMWNYGLDSKFEFIDAIAASFPLHDKGFLGALRVANIHKNLVLNWLNVGRTRYVATYAIGGSLVRGTADETSDVDTFVIIDDTDVKRMSRVELLEKLRGKIVYEYVKEATALAGVKNILNVQVYLLTDFWQSVKDAHPVMFTFIRDGVPMYDRGTFIPWKRLLQMGKIKPSPEAIDLFMKEGDRTDELVKRRLMDAMVDIYYGVLTPTQALMMLSGNAPPVPKTVVAEVRAALVEKEKVMTEKDLKTLERAVKLFKDYEHGTLKEIPGKDIDSLMEEFKVYQKRMKEVREKLEKRMQEHQTDKIHEEAFDLMKKVFGDKNQEELVKTFEKEMVKKGKVPERFAHIAKELSDIKKKVKSKKLTQSEMQQISRDAADFMDALTEYSQRRELVSVQRGIMQISYKDRKADIVATDEGVFLVEPEAIRRITKSGFVDATKEEFEKALKSSKERLKYSLEAWVLELLRKELGEFTVSF